MYYPKLGIIFPHIPKTGGSTLEYFIGELEEPKTFELYSKEKQKMEFLNFLYEKNCLSHSKIRWETIHRSANIYAKHLGQERYDACYSFSFIRNPFAQIRSLYTMKYEYKKKVGKNYPKWEEFILNDNGKCIEKLRDYFDQNSYVNNENGELMINELFPFEYYKESVILLGKKIGFKPNFSVRLWATNSKYEFSPDMIERVMDLYGSSYILWKEVKTYWEKTGKPYTI